MFDFTFNHQRRHLTLLVFLMEHLKFYLLSKHVPNEKKAGFYLYWVNQFYNHCNKSISDRVESENIDRYLKSLARHREDWQIKQASEAIKLYLFFKRKNQATQSNRSLDVNEQWESVVIDMKKMLRLKHLSFRTEQTYLGWILRFCYYLNGQHPNRLTSTHVKDFMTHLAVGCSAAHLEPCHGLSSAYPLPRAGRRI
jgi:hypothetical protein